MSTKKAYTEAYEVAVALGYKYVAEVMSHPDKLKLCGKQYEGLGDFWQFLFTLAINSLEE